jgi:hypothetical protein
MGRPSKRAVPNVKEYALAGTACLLAAIVPIFLTGLVTSLPASASKDTLPDGTCTIGHGRANLLALLVAAGALVAVGLRYGFSRQLYNWLWVGAGVAVLLPGTAYIALERTVVTDAGFSVRTWWGVVRDDVKYADLKGVRMWMEERPPWSRRNTLRRVVFETKDGQSGYVLSGRYHGPYFVAAGSEIVLRWGKFIRGGAWPKPDFPHQPNADRK